MTETRRALISNRRLELASYSTHWNHVTLYISQAVSANVYNERTWRQRSCVQRTTCMVSRLRRLNAQSNDVSDSSWPSSDGSWRKTLLLSRRVRKRRHWPTDVGTTRRRLRRTSSVSRQSRLSSGSWVMPQSTRMRLRNWQNSPTSGRLLTRVFST